WPGPERSVERAGPLRLTALALDPGPAQLLGRQRHLEVRRHPVRRRLARRCNRPADREELQEDRHRLEETEIQWMRMARRSDSSAWAGWGGRWPPTSRGRATSSSSGTPIATWRCGLRM